jgi:PAS domain S-box-containing protein
VLVVDDSPVVRNRLRSLLADTPGVRVVGEAEGVADAVAAIRLSRPDAVILDVRIKNGTGLDVLERVRDLNPAPRVVMLTNYDQQEYRDAARALGVVQFLDKSREFDRVAEALGLAPADPLQSGARGADERWQALIEHSSDMIIVIDPLGLVSYASPSTAAVLGYQPGEYLGHSFFEFVHADDLEDVGTGLAELSAGAEKSRREARVRRRDGAWLWVEATATNRIEDPRVRGIVLNVRDVSERMQVLDALRAQVRRQEAVARLGQRALSSGGLDPLFAETARVLCEVLDVEYAEILELESDGALVMRAGRGWSDGAVGRGTVARGAASRAGYTLARGEPVVVADLATETRFVPDALTRDHGVVSGMACVIGERDAPFGVLGVDTSRRRTFTATDVSFLQTVANLLATAVARHASESATRASEAEYRLLMESASDAIMVFDPDLRIVDANERASELAGWPRAELLGRSVFDSVVAADLPASRARAAAVRERGHLLFERPFLRRDGTVVPVEVHARVLPDGRYLSLVRDVSERHRLEARVRIVAEATNDGIWTWDAATDEGWWSDKYAALFGYAAGELSPTHDQWLRLVHPEDRDRVAQRYAAWLASPAPRWDEEYRMVRKDGTVLTVHDRGEASRDDAGRARSIVGALTDVTEQRRIETQFRQSQRLEAVGRLAGGVAHDFNNILSAILGYGQLLKDDFATGGARPEDLDEILRAAGRARDLTRQLLAFSRQQVLDLRVLDMNEVLAGVRNMLGRLLGEDVALALHLDPAAGRLRGDAGQLEQVVMNLAVNARDAMPDGGRLTIETAAVDLDADFARAHVPQVPGPYVLLAVTDTGTGMSADVKARVFEPFFTTKGPHQGTGLGLATVYGIVKQFGGFIWVYSEPGRGTTFKIYLPRVSEPAAPPLPAPPPAVGGRETLLLVEDDAAVRRSTAQLLERLGYTVLRAARGEEALAVGANHPGALDLVISDVVLPELSGPALVQRLLALRPGVGVLFISGYADRAVVRHGLLDGGANFLQKPVAPDRLARKIREVLDGRRQ